MTATLVANIGQLVTNDPSLGDGSPLGILTDAALVLDAGRVVQVCANADAPACDDMVDAAGRCVIPGFVDSHTHMVFAGDRSAEFTARMAGTAYAAGGINTTVDATRAAGDGYLHQHTAALLAQARASGTTTIEIKSGYGLSTADETRLLHVAGEFTDEVTFLGAHVVPAGITSDDYVDLVCGPMLDACAPLARWIDVFCETGAFTLEQSEQILRAGGVAGLGLRIHANQLGHSGAVRLACELDAASADHCTHLDTADIDALASTATVATLLPATEFSTRNPYPPARTLIEAGATVALASNCNPGSSFTSSMPFVIALAVTQMAMTPAEALWSATRGGARALRREDIGQLSVGSRADYAILDAPTYEHLAYRPGVQLVAEVSSSVA